MKTKLISTTQVLLMIILSVVFFACSDDEVPVPDPEEEEPPATVDTLCEGDGDNSFWPLAMNNEWEYETSGAEFTIKVTGTAVYDGKEYYKISEFVDGVELGLFEGYLRNDAAGNVYVYNTVEEADYLYIPAVPVVGDYYLDYPDGSSDDDREVDKYGTPTDFESGLFFCDYDSVLFINSYSNLTGDYEGKDYYVRGVGPVFNGGFGDELIEVHL